MTSRRIIAAVAVLCALIAPAHAQKTKAQLNAEIGTSFPNNTVGGITPQALRTVTSDIVNAILPTAPVVSGHLPCFSGTTGLLSDCGSGIGTSGANVPLLNGINTFSAGQTINPISAATPAITIYTPTSTLGQALNINQSGAGIAPISPPFVLGNFAYNGIMINDAVNGSGPGGVVGGLIVQTNIAGASAQGFHGAGIFTANVNGVVPTDGTFAGAQGLSSLTQSLYPMGGTGTGALDAKGTLYGYSSIVIAYGPGGFWPGATNLLNVTGGEINYKIATGASVYALTGMQVAALPDHAVQGATFDIGYSLSAQVGAVGLRNGFAVSALNGQHPMAAGGTIFGTIGAGTAGYGVDVSSYTLTLGQFKGKNFLVTDTEVQLGTAGTARGQIKFAGATSGNTTLHAAAAASGDQQLPAGATVLAGLSIQQTWDGQQLYLKDKFVLVPGTGGGALTLNVGNGAAAGTLTLPQGTTDFSATGGAGQVVKQSTAGGAFTVGTLTPSDITGLGTNVGAWLATPSGANLAAALTSALPATAGGTGLTSGTSGGVLYFSSGTTIASSGQLGGSAIVVGGGPGGPPATLGSLGTTTQVLHGNAAGPPSFGAVVSADMNITTTSCTNQFVSAISAGGVGTCTTDTLASAQHANQGTTTQFLKGNAAGNPAWSAVSLTTDVTGVLQAAQEPAHTGDVTNTAGSLALTIANNAVTLAKMATQPTNTVLANVTSGTAVPTAFAVGSCDTATKALQWTTNTGFACNSSITAAAMPTTGLTGTLQAAQFPALTGSVTTSAGSLATTVTPTAPSTTTPTPVCGSGAGYTLSSSIQYVQQFGSKWVNIAGTITVTTIGTCANNIQVALPVTASSTYGGGLAGINVTNGKPVMGAINPATPTIATFLATDGTGIPASGSGQTIAFSGGYFAP